MANYKKILPLLREVEGGLSKAKTDEASKHPVPDGSGYHTNKGITWETFEFAAKACGYMAIPVLFYSMPDWVWEQIFKHIYWDQIQGDKIVSQAIADTTVDWCWAAGPVTGAKKLQQFVGVKSDGVYGPVTLKAISDRVAAGEKQFNDELSEYKLGWYLSLDKNLGDGKGFELNYEGWKVRLKKIHEFTNSEIL